MSKYEKEQQQLQALEEALIDEEPYEYSSESYNESDDEESSLQLSSDSSSDELIPNTNLTDVKWNSITGSNLREFVFGLSSVGIKAYVIQEMQNKDPVDFFLFINEKLLNRMMVETHSYATQKLTKSFLPKSRIKKWQDVDIEEMKFFGITNVDWLNSNTKIILSLV
ncbi:hypothetical protein ILUMI_21451 [Ignelater luminosus]|uniref:PiggyBac transposable element-derived protein domain-containing protein n=1 Tax=Ignelater luminosus TaxID=2038154 RepID=A0A8K0CIW0_IGNLU|nr:hypothetical protein ILUMI_21451 [Ignelater luminosus]